MKPLFALALIVIFLHACKSTSYIDADSSDTHISSSDNYDNKILTIILEFEIDTINHQDNINLAHKIISDGKLKQDSHRLDSEHTYQLVFCNHAGAELKRISLADPLRKMMEHSNEEGEISMSDVTLDKDAVSIRMKFSKELTKLKIYKQVNAELRLVNSFEL